MPAKKQDAGRGRIEVSAVIPACNEQDNVEVLAAELHKALRGHSHEILFIDDGSRDETLQRIKQLRKKDPLIHFISLSRNFGHQNALKAGLDHAVGDCVITMDADLQHPPQLIPQMMEKWREGFEVVYTVRDENSSASWLKRLTSRTFYRLVNLISEVHLQEGAADFRLLDRSVVDALGRVEETPFYRGFVPWMGFRQAGIHYAPSKRHAGRTKYSLLKMIGFALGGLVSFSVIPLRFATILGFLMAITGFSIGLKAVINYLFTHNTVPGWSSTIVTVVLVGGVQLIVLGVIGEYLGRLFIESKRRPHYIVRESSRRMRGR